MAMADRIPAPKTGCRPSFTTLISTWFTANSSDMPVSAMTPKASIRFRRSMLSLRAFRTQAPAGAASLRPGPVSSRRGARQGAGKRWRCGAECHKRPEPPDPGPRSSAMSDTIIARCEAKGLRMTDQRRIVAQVIGAAEDHPDVEALYTRAAAIDPRISIATVYRTVKLFEEAGILDRLEFGDGRARYEDAERDHHDHMIDMNSGAVIEFVDPEIEALQQRIADRLGYRLVGHRLELYGVPVKKG
jgi:Fur family ferric uptake transcriptional regulator